MTLEPTLYSARWLLPVNGPPIRDGAMLVDASGRIVRVAPSAEFAEVSAVRRIDFAEAAVLPGLVNVHAHPELAAFRGLLEDLPFHQWIPTLMRAKRGAQLTPEDYQGSAQWTCAESLRAGITTMGATEDSGAAAAALRIAGMRGTVFLETFGPASQQVDAAMTELHNKLERVSADLSETVRAGVSPHAPYTVSDALYRAVAEFAREQRLPLATHAAEAEAEELLVREALGPFAAGLRSRGIETTPRARSTIDLLQRTGVLDCAPLLIHVVRADAADLELIRAAGASIAHCPVANARLGHGIAPIIEARTNGITVGIGTDSVASNNRLDLLEEAHIAQAMQRARLQSAGALDSDTLLRLCTIEGARILGLDSRIGTLEAGKDADFCVVALDTTNAAPVADPVAAVFHAARGSDVVFTAVAGRPLFERGRFHTLDVRSLHQAIVNIGARLLEAKQTS